MEECAIAKKILIIYSLLDNAPNYLVGCIIQKSSMCILETLQVQCVMSRSRTDLINHLKRQEKEFLD